MSTIGVGPACRLLPLVDSLSKSLESPVMAFTHIGPASLHVLS